MARPKKLTDELLTKLDEIAADGLTIKEVCTRIGISEDSWRRWELSDEKDELAERFRGLAARVRAGMGRATDDLAWGALREVLADASTRASDKIAAAATILRLRTAHRVELTGRDGGPVEVDASSARAKLLAQLEQIDARRRAARDDAGA